MEPDVRGPNEGTEQVTVVDLALLLLGNLRLVFVVPLCLGLLALAASFLISPTYIATVRLLPPAAQQGLSATVAAQLGAFAGVLGSSTSIKNPADQYAAFIKSRTISDGIIRRFDLLKFYDERYFEDARRVLQKRTTVTVGAKDGVISIDVEDEDRERAAKMANAFVDELRALSNTLAITEAGQRRLFFETQLKRTKDDLTRSEIALRTSGVGEATLKTLPQSTLEAIARLKAQVTAQEIRIAAMRSSMTEQNPQLILARQELAALNAELGKAEHSNSTKASGDGNEYIARYRDFKYHETLFELMAKQYELARLDEAKEGGVIQVIDAAQVPERKAKPKRGIIAAVTTFLAFVLMAVFVVVRWHIARTIKRGGVYAENIRRLQKILWIRQPR